MKRAALALCGVMIALGPSADARVAQQATFSARANTVRIDALVTENGRVLTGLTPADFEVLDNGVAQDVALLSADALPLHLVLALDLSESVDNERRERLRRAGVALLDALHPDDEAGLLTFGKRVAVRIPVTADLQPMRGALDRLSIVGSGTALVDAAFAGMALADAELGRPLLMMFSDGIETASWLEAKDVLNAARGLNVTVYSVLVKAPASGEFLHDLSNATGGRVIPVDASANLSSAFVAALDEFRHRYLLGYTPKGVTTTGWHKLDVRVKRKGAVVTARRGYQGS